MTIKENKETIKEKRSLKELSKRLGKILSKGEKLRNNEENNDRQGRNFKNNRGNCPWTDF